MRFGRFIALFLATTAGLTPVRGMLRLLRMRLIHARMGNVTWEGFWPAWQSLRCLSSRVKYVVGASIQRTRKTAKPRWQKRQLFELLYCFGGRFAHRAETSPAFAQVEGTVDATPLFASQENRTKAQIRGANAMPVWQFPPGHLPDAPR